MTLGEATVILFCGLPASGKSTLARQVQKHFHRPGGECSVLHLEYDALEDELIPDIPDIHHNHHHQQQQEKDFLQARLDAWNQARALALQELETKIQEWRKGRRERERGAAAEEESEEHSDNNSSLLILMDDNFHLRGMRKQVHRILLNHKPVKFGLIWVETPISECLERNKHRERKIPEHVISKMESTFEPPKANWESNWMKVTTEATTATTTTTVHEEIYHFVRTCREIEDLPAEVSIDYLEQQAVDRTQTQLNQRHQWDKLLRSWVGQVAKYDKRYARGANDARKKILLIIKEPNKEIIGNDLELLDAFLETLALSSNGLLSIDQRSELKDLLSKE